MGCSIGHYCRGVHCDSVSGASIMGSNRIPAVDDALGVGCDVSGAGAKNQLERFENYSLVESEGEMTIPDMQINPFTDMVTIEFRAERKAEVILKGIVAAGTVDETAITEVRECDLISYNVIGE